MGGCVNIPFFLAFQQGATLSRLSTLCRKDLILSPFCLRGAHMENGCHHLIYDQRVGIALRIRGPLADEAAKRRVEIGKQTGRGNRKVSPKSGEPLGKSTAQAAKQVKVGKTAVEEMLAEQEHQPDIAE